MDWTLRDIRQGMAVLALDGEVVGHVAEVTDRKLVAMTPNGKRMGAPVATISHVSESVHLKTSAADVREINEPGEATADKSGEQGTPTAFG